MTLLLYLASALTVDLGFDRLPAACLDKVKSQTKPASPSTLEEYRVLCGVYYLTSFFSTSFRKTDPIPWTPYIENCLQELEASCQMESDLLLVQLVRIQHLIGETTAVRIRTSNAPTDIHINAFTADLNRLRRRDQYRDQDNLQLQMQYLQADVHIYELSLANVTENECDSLHPHVESLYTLIDKIRGLMSVFARFRADTYVTLPFSIFGQYAHSFITYTKLASLEVDGWNTDYLKTKMQFLACIDEAVVRYDTAINCGPDGMIVNNQVFTEWSRRLRWMKGIYETKFLNPQPQILDNNGGTMVQNTPTMTGPSLPRLVCEQVPMTAMVPSLQHLQQPTPPDDVFANDLFSYLDESFWQGFPTSLDLGWNEMLPQPQSSSMQSGS